MAFKGKFKPRNPEKYIGDSSKIIYRSQLETRFFNFCDTSPSIMSWASEEMFVPYISPKDNRMHRYFPDVLIKKKLSDDTTEIVMIEIKPASQSKPPKKGKTKKAERRYIKECITWAVNSAKWEAAQKYCKERGWKWQVLNEVHLGVNYGRRHNPKK